MSRTAYKHEGALLKTSCELLSSCLRNEQKLIEREMATFQRAVKKVMLEVKKKGMTPTSLALLESLIKQIAALKKKLSEAHDRETYHLNRCRSRILHLQVVDPSSSFSALQLKDEGKLQRWEDIRLNRLIVDFLLRQGMFDVASQIAENTQCDDFIDAKIFLDGKKVLDSLKQKKLNIALAWCTVNRGQLRKIKSSLEFQFRLQEFLETVAKGNLKEGVEYARKHFPPFKDIHGGTIQRAMASLAFRRRGDKAHVLGSKVLPPSNLCDPYEDLYDSKRWDFLIEEFKRDNIAAAALSPKPLIYYYLTSGIIGLKTRDCDDAHSSNLSCPTCFPLIQELGGGLPLSQRTTSSVVCRITGEVMDEHNPPLVLPNGYVYSQKAMEEMANKNGGVITCPRTKETCAYSDLKKAFIA